MPSEITVKVTPSLDKLGNAFSRVDMEKFMREETVKFAALTERFAKQITPVVSGRLMGSIGHASILGEIAAVALTNIHYAIYVHEGTRFMRGRPFMEQGAKFAKQRWEGEIGKRLEDHIRIKLKKL